MGQTVIGLDIGTWSVKAAILDSGLRRFMLKEFRESRLELDATGNPVMARTSDAVKEALEGVTVRNAIVTAVPGLRVFNRELELPFQDDKKIQSVLAFELDGVFPAPIDELVYDYVVLERREHGSKLLCSAVSKNALRTLVGELNEAGADPKIVALDTLTAADLVGHLDAISTDELEPDQAVVLIDVGHTTTSISIVRDGHPELMRTIKKGGLEITRALMSEYGWDYPTAEEYKHGQLRLEDPADPELTPERRHLAQVAERALEPILRDIRMTLHSFTSRKRVDIASVFLYGGGARLMGLKERISNVLNLTVNSVRTRSLPWCKADLKASDELVVPNAAALGLRFRREGEAKALNFRQGDMAFESDFKAFRERGTWLAIVCVLLVAAFLGRIFVKKSVLSNNQDRLAAALVNYTKATFGPNTKKVFGVEDPGFSAVLAKVQTPPRHAGLVVMPKMSAFRAVYEIGSMVHEVNGMRQEGEAEEEPKDKEGAEAEPKKPKDLRYRIELEQVNVDAKKAMIRGKMRPFEALSAFKLKLKEHACFEIAEEPRVSNVRRRGGDFKQQFNMSVRLLCSDPKLENEKLKAKKKRKSGTKGGAKKGSGTEGR